MTEAEWIACTDPTPMLTFLGDQASDRKLRLFAVACCRRFWTLFTDERSRMAITVAERFADGLVSARELNATWQAASQVPEAKVPYNATLHVTAEDGPEASWEVATYLAGIIAPNPDEERAAQAELLRDIVGNPFRPVTLDHSWRQAQVVQLARTLYDDRAFDRLPSLADVLEGAGCHNAEILAHGRQPGEHVRGCWLVDLLLGKE